MEKESLLDLIDRLKAGCIANEWRMMEETGLSPAEYNGIAALKPHENINGSDLSQKMALSPSRASRVLDKMVKNGYLLRENDAHDRRKCTISLAKKGLDIKKKIAKLKTDCEQKIRERLSEPEIEAITAGLKKIIDVF
ncbi:MAG TPA: MarR family winged helix-turn-helix transcriptional regulator [Candidatus Kapabacteria bacterium]|nr:MarR family winged helix-turn-helix transcriptional regulator [Candidatus Kapabacteria bacterium]